MVTNTRTHTFVGFANPYFICETCREKVPYWHDPERCHCDLNSYNYPCEHKLGVISSCPTWDPVEGCNCSSSEMHIS